LLKLGDWDPDVFFKFRDSVLNQISNCGQKLRNDICRGIPRLWENYYMLDLDKDIAFEIGRYFYGIRDYTNALNFYMESTSTIGEHHVTYHNQGLCHYSRGYLEVALAHFEKAISLNSSYEKARNWIEKVNKELAEKAKKDGDEDKAGNDTTPSTASTGNESEKTAARNMVESVLADMTLNTTANTLPPTPPTSTVVEKPDGV
jgi:tetratricopeptide (TPR) repeat protein